LPFSWTASLTRKSLVYASYENARVSTDIRFVGDKNILWPDPCRLSTKVQWSVCLVVIHHDFCSDGYERLLGFIEQLNALKVPLVWRCLGDVVRRSYRQKQASANSVEVEVYGKTLIQNVSSHSMRYFIGRREHAPWSIESISAGPHQIWWDSAEDRIQLELELLAGDSALLTVRFKSVEEVAPQRQNVAYNAKTMPRRYLSEARDNYVVPAKARMFVLFLMRHMAWNQLRTLFKLRRSNYSPTRMWRMID
jgi:hypothetical protein